jgi:hypothetical protein
MLLGVQWEGHNSTSVSAMLGDPIPLEVNFQLAISTDS